MKTLKILMACLSVVIAFSSEAKTKNEAEVTQYLLDQSYTIQESTVDGLLQAIEANTYFHSHNQTLPYNNLAAFVPFSHETALKVLNVVEKAISEKTTFVRLDNLLLNFVNDSLRTRAFADKIYKIMAKLPPSEPQRLAAVTVSRSAFYRTEAIEVLKNLLTDSSVATLTNMHAAFNLLKLKEHTEAAEAVLIAQMKDAGTLSSIIVFADNAYSKEISDNLFAELKKAIALFPKQSSLYAYEGRLQRINEKRNHKIMPCDNALNDNVIEFPKKKKE